MKLASFLRISRALAGTTGVIVSLAVLGVPGDLPAWRGLFGGILLGVSLSYLDELMREKVEDEK